MKKTIQFEFIASTAGLFRTVGGGFRENYSQGVGREQRVG